MRSLATDYETWLSILKPQIKKRYSSNTNASTQSDQEVEVPTASPTATVRAIGNKATEPPNFPKLGTR